MAVEPKRGCGFRKVGGLYLFGGGIGIPCDRLPFELTICPCCGQGVKQARGWTWIDVAKFFQGPHMLPIAAGSVAPPEKLWHCYCAGGGCPLCCKPESMGRAGLLWIGEKFYKTPGEFVKEGVELGFSRRIQSIPHGFKIGETWVLLAHKNAITTRQTVTEILENYGEDVAAGRITKEEAIERSLQPVFAPGIFYAWRPQRIEKICLESTRDTKEIADLVMRGITPVFVPDSDKDHQGNVHDDFDKEHGKDVKSQRGEN
jgi:hypothetical protein